MIETIEVDWRFGRSEVPAQDRYLRPAIEITGEYSGRETDLYQTLLRPGDVALDVGANVGVFAIAMGLAVGPAGRVHAFEPQPPIFGILERNLTRHGLDHVEAHRAIVSDAAGDGEFVAVHALPEGSVLNFGGLSLSTRIRSEFGTMASTPKHRVDDLRLARCDLIKIDVEGAEEAVLAGAGETVTRCRPILSIECDRPGGASPWVDGFLAAGYRLWRFRGTYMRTPNPKGASLDGLANFTAIMVLAVPEERLDSMAGVDRSALQWIDSRETLELLSRRIVVDGANQQPG